jgi:hypothetical protein
MFGGVVHLLEPLSQMLKKLVISFLIIAAVLITAAFLYLNPVYGFYGKDNFNFTVSGKLKIEQLEVRHGFYSINRDSDQMLFEIKADVIFDGNSSIKKRIEYGENDFLIIYNQRYYYQFRQFKMHHRAFHDYNFNISESDTGFKIDVNIEGVDKMIFRREMNLISNAENLRCNVLKQEAGHIYNMKELTN